MKKNNKTITFLKQKSYLLAAVLMLAAVLGMVGVYVTEQQNEKNQLAQEQSGQQGVQELARQDSEESSLQEEGLTAGIYQENPLANTDFLDSPEAIAVKEENSTLKEDAKETEETLAEGATAEGAAAKEATAEGSTVEETTADAQVQETAAQTMQKLHFDAANEMQWPLQGNVIMNYSMDQTIYFATLDQYKYNPAIIIQGKVNDKVLSVADGTISNIETNEETGCTVTVDLGDGYSAVYGQLKEVDYHAGDYVEAGAVIGYVNEPTKYYSVEGPNLYFQLIKANESVDPMEFLQ